MLTNISIAAEGFDAYDLEPAGFPDLLAERPLVALGKWRGTPAGRIVIRGQSGGGPYEQVLDVGAVAPSPANQALGQLWARARVAALGGLRVDRLRRGAPGRHRLARPEVQPAHRLHVLRRRPRGGEESGGRGSPT